MATRFERRLLASLILSSLCMAASGATATAQAFSFPWSTPPKQIESHGNTPIAPKERRVIVVDPGHGGVDGGTVGSGLLEKNLTLDLSKRVRQLLEKTGYTVMMTRDQDTDVSRLFPSRLSTRHKRDLQNRLDLIRQSRAVGAVSIHINSSTNPADRGPIVFYATHAEASKVLATKVQAALNAVSGSTQRPLGRKNLFIIRHSPCPAILVEVGFITNNHDVARLQTQAYRDRVATAIATALDDELRHAPIPPVYEKQPAD
ncbi:MAG: N-acetylmuramoyl-L-alanine amidase [Firmicutes bacterium]|nr:N-acetylmuramoyl-L-alanine amidase [Bacillota bacterium]